MIQKVQEKIRKKLLFWSERINFLTFRSAANVSQKEWKSTTWVGGGSNKVQKEVRLRKISEKSSNSMLENPSSNSIKLSSIQVKQKSTSLTYICFRFQLFFQLLRYVSLTRRDASWTRQFKSNSILAEFNSSWPYLGTNGLWQPCICGHHAVSRAYFLFQTKCRKTQTIYFLFNSTAKSVQFLLRKSSTV